MPEYLASGRRSLRGLAETVGYVAVDWPTDPEDPFFNINTSADLVEAERRIQR
jgi:molybdopterin-guanine dinucleotide biosynthesis protein A